MTRRRLVPAARLAVSLALLALLWQLADGPAALARLRDADVGWLLLGLALSLPQVLLSAERWRFTAGRLGAKLPRRTAIAEYYLAGLLNQVLPGGVAGDLLRAWRHGRDDDRTRSAGYAPAVHAVMLERFSGYLSLLPFAAAGLLLWPVSSPADAAAGLGSRQMTAVALVALPLAGLAVLGLRRLARQPRVARFLADARLALFHRDALPRQMLLSLAIFASYLAVFTCAALAVGAGLTPLLLLTGVPLVLLAMALPISFGGWGLREAAAAGLWLLAGLPAEDGLAASIAYGLLVLFASLPGALVLLARAVPR